MHMEFIIRIYMYLAAQKKRYGVFDLISIFSQAEICVAFPKILSTCSAMYMLDVN